MFSVVRQLETNRDALTQRRKSTSTTSTTAFPDSLPTATTQLDNSTTATTKSQGDVKETTTSQHDFMQPTITTQHVFQHETEKIVVTKKFHSPYC